MTIAMHSIYTQTTSGATTARITFNNIPQTFTDLVIKVSQRNTHTALTDPFVIGFNNDTNGLYSATSFGGDGSSVNTFRSNLNAYLSYTNNMSVNGATSTANTFGSLELYIPNYTSSNFKSIIVDSVTEHNATGGPIAGLLAGLWRSTAAISRIDIIGYNAAIGPGSTISIYGITKG
jgi:hypothetical protein